MTGEQTLFAVFGIVSQALLVAFFGSHRWWPRRDWLLGRLAYSFAWLGVPIGAWLVLDGESWRLFVGPLLMAAWAAFGWAIDVWRPRRWRGPPVEWSVLAPYLALYFVAQMFLWWPLWEFAILAWIVFFVLFAVNTALNIRWHAEALSHS